jgi:tRNA threonylcarbamoyl adenosine modification protein (Sua5/YciO/YrdC/YwlC family)
VAKILAVQPNAPDDKTVRIASEALRRGEVVALPTDTLYGLCALASNTKTIQQLFSVKGRTDKKGTPILIGNMEQLALLSKHFPPQANRVMTALWPGALTLILPAREDVPVPLIEDKGIAVRMPDQALCMAIALKSGPFAATSANRPGNPPLDSTSAIDSEFGELTSLILDGGKIEGGLASTVVDIRGEKPILIREGTVLFVSVVAAWESHSKSYG